MKDNEKCDSSTTRNPTPDTCKVCSLKGQNFRVLSCLLPGHACSDVSCCL